MPTSATVSVEIDKEVKTDLEKIAKELDLSVSKLARNLIYTSLDDYKLLNAFNLSSVIGRFKQNCGTLEPYSSKQTNVIPETAKISVILRTDIKAEIETYANELGVPFKTLARNLIYIGLKNTKLLRVTGVFKITTAFRDFMNSYFKN